MNQNAQATALPSPAVAAPPDPAAELRPDAAARSPDPNAQLRSDPAARPSDPAAELRPIREVARLVGLTPRAIRYYEGLGLIEPAARSAGAYRLFSTQDVERLRRIKALRDDAGFSLAEIGRFVADEDALAEARTAYRATLDPLVRRRLATEGVARLASQVELLRAKIERLAAMVGDAEARRGRLLAAIAELDATVKVEAR